MTTYFDDGFSGTLNTALAGRSADTTGGAWSTLSAPSGTLVLSGDGHIFSTKTGSQTTPIVGVPTIAVGDYDVSIEIDAKSILANDGVYVWTRCDNTPSNGYYMFLAQNGAIELNRFVSGAATKIIGGTVSLAGGSNHTIKIKHNGSTLSLYYDGALVTATSGSNPVTDATFAGPGRVAVRLGSSASNTQSSSTGLQPSRILIEDAAPLTPANTSAPVVSGTRVVGYTLSCTTGSWTGSPTSYAYQWRRDGSAIGSATASTYTLVGADVGTTVTCEVTATNASGSSSPVASNGLVIVAIMVAGDVQWLVGGPDGLGGAPGSAITNPRTIFDDVLNSEAVAGDTEYRLVYMKNAHAVQSLNSTVAWIQANTSSTDTTLAIGVATETAGSNVAAVADEQTAPAGVTFGSPSTSGTGFSLGNIPAGSFKGLWLRRTVNASAVPTGTDAAEIDWQGTPT